MTTPEAEPPIVVVVANGRYDCFGPDTPRSSELVRILRDVLGGVNESVSDGTYHFNVESLGGFDVVCTFEPFDDSSD